MRRLPPAKGFSAHTNLHPDLFIHLGNLLCRVIGARRNTLGRSSNSLMLLLLLLLLLLHLHHCGRWVVVGHCDVMRCAARVETARQRWTELTAAKCEASSEASLSRDEVYGCVRPGAMESAPNRRAFFGLWGGRPGSDERTTGPSLQAAVWARLGAQER